MHRRSTTTPLPAVAARPHLPRRVGPYLTQSVLGAGGMGVVYRARRESDGKSVALKVMATPDLVGRNLAAERRFEREASALSRIQHPNVVRLEDFGHLADGTLFCAMELLEGSVLTSVLRRRRRLTPRQALPYVVQICAGLQAAHDTGVVHRDLKPDNVFVVQERPVHIKVFDFGVAKLLDHSDQLTAAGIMVGTPVYFAPEQAMGEARLIGPQTDLYSLGVLLYGMLSGAFPFYSEATAQLVLHHINRPPPPLRDRVPAVPAEVARVVHWCLEKDPADRPASARELSAAYARAVGQEPDSAETVYVVQPRGRAAVPAPLDPYVSQQIETVIVEPRQPAADDNQQTQLARSRPRLRTPQGDTDRRQLTPWPQPRHRPRVQVKPAPPSPQVRVRSTARPAEQAPIQTIDLLRAPIEAVPDPLPPLIASARPRRPRWPVYVVFSMALLVVSLALGVALQWVTG